MTTKQGKKGRGREPLPDHELRKPAVYYVTDAERPALDAAMEEIKKAREVEAFAAASKICGE